jgi:hypothetical protein
MAARLVGTTSDLHHPTVCIPGLVNKFIDMPAPLSNAQGPHAIIAA